MVVLNQQASPPAGELAKGVGFDGWIEGSFGDAREGPPHVSKKTSSSGRKSPPANGPGEGEVNQIT
jgi:hypothetical protein